MDVSTNIYSWQLWINLHLRLHVKMLVQLTTNVLFLDLIVFWMQIQK